MRFTLRGVALAAVAAAACAYTAFNSPLGADYPGPACKGCDFAGPPIDALARGHVQAFFDTQPFMGPVTVLLRAPVVALTRSQGGGELLEYRLGCLVCLLLSAILVAWLLRSVRRTHGQWLLHAGLAVLILAGPFAQAALRWGHPEELVGALLCVCAVVSASRGQTRLAGVALGLALATKQWALLAVIPTLIVCRQDRRKVLAIAAGVAALLLVPMLSGDPARFLSQNLNAGLASSGGKLSGVTPTNIWFAWARQVGQVVGSGAAYSIPTSINSITHPLALVAGFGLPLVFWRARPHATLSDALAVLAAVFLLRCLLDPLSLSYHHVPFFVALAASEGLRRRGVPVVTLYSTAAFWALGRFAAPVGADTLNASYLLWTLPVLGYLVLRSFRRAAVEPERSTASRLEALVAP